MTSVWIPTRNKYNPPRKGKLSLFATIDLQDCQPAGAIDAGKLPAVRRNNRCCDGIVGRVGG
jgi:hypothetical protein